MSHTKGEWIKEGSNFIYCLNTHGYNRWSLSVQRGCEDDHTRMTEEEVAKIANLLHAAPALLEALKGLMGSMGSASMMDGEQLKATNAALQAIAQAEGRAS